VTEVLTRTAGAGPDGYVPPQSLEAERAALAAMLLDGDAVGRAIEYIDPEEFYRVSHQRIYAAIIALYNRNERADLITLAEELRKRGDLEAVGGPAALAQLFDYATTSANLEQHLKIVHAKAVLRSLIKASQEIQQDCFVAEAETVEILDRAEQRIFAITDQRVRQGFFALRELLKPAFEHIHKLYERKAAVTGVTSGYDDLDQRTAGFQPSDLIIVAGRPSMGKTSFALNIAENAAIPRERDRPAVPVAVFSLEMSKEQLVQRLLCSQSEVPLHKVRNGYLANEDWPRLTTAAGLLQQAPIMIDDSPMLTVMEVRAKCRRLRAEGKLGLVLIDYLQLLRPGGPAENRVQEISQITRGLKALAKELNVPIIALSQLSRQVETRDKSGRPQLSDLRESGCLTADTTILRADTGAPVTLGELHASGERNIPVWSLDEDLKLVQRTMTHVFSSGVKPVFELRLASGYTVKASANHPFLTLDGWVPLSDLSPGTRLATPRELSEPRSRIEWTENRIVLLAHMIGDGCFASGQPVHYTSADEANLEAVETAALEFGVQARRVHQGNWSHLYLPAPFKLARGRYNPITQWLRELGMDGSRRWEKRIPAAIFNLGQDQLALFLRHLWATDGCLHLGRNQARVYYASTSRELIDGVKLLLLRFGIVARVKVVRKAGYRQLYHLHVYGLRHQRRFLETIGAFGRKELVARRILAHLASRTANSNVDTLPIEVWRNVRSSMGRHGVTARALASGLEMVYCGSALYKAAPTPERLARVAAVLEDPELMTMARSDVFWDRIVAIEPLGEEEVFDATVPGTHNFIANGIVAHNSIEQDADVVLFVYREVVYKRDTPEPLKAQILIAKQRNGPTGDVDLTFLRDCTKFVPYSPMMPGETEPEF
jgi:replicative DNA helicase